MRVLLEEVVLGEPGVLPVVLVAGLAQRHLADEPVVLGVRVGGSHVPVDEPTLEEAEFHVTRSFAARRNAGFIFRTCYKI